MKKLSFLSFLLILIGISSCQNAEKKAMSKGLMVTGKVVVFEMKKNVADGDWFEIDGIRIYHQANDTLVTILDPTMYDPMYVNADEVKENVYYTLGATSYMPLGTKVWRTLNVDRGMIASNLLKAINVASNPTAGEPVYNFAGDIIMVLAGRLEISRTDGKPLTIKISENYPALLSVLE